MTLLLEGMNSMVAFLDVSLTGLDHVVHWSTDEVVCYFSWLLDSEHFQCKDLVQVELGKPSVFQ